MKTNYIFVDAWSYSNSVASDRPVSLALWQKTTRLLTRVDRHYRRHCKVIHSLRKRGRVVDDPKPKRGKGQSVLTTSRKPSPLAIYLASSLVPRPSRGRREKAWYRQHAHAPTSPRFRGTRLRTDTVGHLYFKLLVF